MTDHLANSFWLDDWRKYADEADLSPKGRRIVQEAIHRAELKWATQHADVYRGLADARFTTRNEGVVGACEEMRAELREITSAVSAGQMTPKEARARVRDVHAGYQQVTKLHEKVLGEEDELAAFAEMSPDDYQRDQLNRLPVLKQTQPTLVAMAQKIDPPPPPGGRLGPIDNPPPPTYDAPSFDDLGR